MSLTYSGGCLDRGQVAKVLSSAVNYWDVMDVKRNSIFSLMSPCAADSAPMFE